MHFPLARDGLRELLICTALLGGGAGVSAWAALAVSPWFWMAAVPLSALWLFTVAFFRDPQRSVPDGPGLFVSPADGRVTEVSRLENHEHIGGPALKISMFLSIFNVHVNRTACDGRVIRTEYQPGEFLDARAPECGIRNENNTIVIEPGGGLPGPVIVRQVAGMVARRIVCKVGAGDILRRGQRIGLIKFGSRTDLVVPAVEGLEAIVRVGDSVKGGSSVLMRLTKAAEHGIGPRQNREAERLAASPGA
jgi:phosphatidylserine decarboxylase